MAGKLSQSQKTVLTIVLSALVLTLLGHVGIWKWYQPDLRYEIGSYYRSRGTAVASLKLQNYGNADANVVKVAVAFPSTLRNVTSSEPTVPFEILEGGVGSRSVVGRLSRVVPGQTLYLYFAVVDPGGMLAREYESYVSGITFSGGQARQGLPLRTYLAGFVWGLMVVFPLCVILVRLALRKAWGSRRGAGLAFGIGAAKNAVVDSMVSIQSVIELSNDVEKLVRAGESLPKPFVERFSKYRTDASKMKKRLLSHSRPPGSEGGK